MSAQENAKENLRRFANDMGAQDLQFDENMTCVHLIDENIELHFTYTDEKLFIFSPYAIKLQEEREDFLLEFYKLILKANSLGLYCLGGGIGLINNDGEEKWIAGAEAELGTNELDEYKNIIVIHIILDMENPNPNQLNETMKKFIEIVFIWRKIFLTIEMGEIPNLEEEFKSLFDIGKNKSSNSEKSDGLLKI